MIEFTILLDDSELEFEPASNSPELSFILPPTARIGRDDDVAHLAPIPVHCFFNAMTLGHWLAREHSLSESDAFAVYAIHDMFKALFHVVRGRNGRRNWPHSRKRFDHLQRHPSGLGLDDPSKVLSIARDHHRPSVSWKEVARHEGALEAGVEAPYDRRYTWEWPLIGLSIRLQSALSNALSIAYVKRLFVDSYVEAIRAEYPDVFARYDAISYQYEFVDPTALTDETEKDVEKLCRQSAAELAGRRLVIRTFIGASGPHWHPGQKTKVCLPFWLLLTLHEDPISILFPVPTVYGSDGNPADNPAFVARVRNAFLRRVRDLLEETRVTASKRSQWNARIDDIIAGVDDTFHIVHTTAFDEVTDARRLDAAKATETCSMCGSPVPDSFVCSPVTDLGFSRSNYTDWHLGDADRACVLCAISQFRTPGALEPARRLIFQRKAVYFATSTPSARRKPDIAPAATPFFEAPGFAPKLEIRSLESLVTLNIIAALYLHNTLQRAVSLHNGAPDLWLEATFPTSPFSFIGHVAKAKSKARMPDGHVAKAKSKARMPDFLVTLFENLNRSVTLLDPLIPMQVEVPFHALACLWGVSKGRHYEFKYKPLLVSNETGILPIIWEGYHFVDRETLSAIESLRAFVEAFRQPRVTPRMMLTALASGPQEFVEILIDPGRFGYGTILERIGQLSDGADAMSYLREMREWVVQTPLVTEIWG